MHNGVAVLCILLLHSSRLDDIAALLVHIQLDNAIGFLIGVGDLVQLFLMQPVHVPNVPEPRIQDPQILRRKGRLDTPAPVMPAHDNVLDMQMAHSIVEHTHDVEIRVRDHIGDVAVDEGLSGLESRDLLGRDARIATSNPQILWLLARGEFLEEFRVFLLLLRGPLLVVGEDVLVGRLQVLGDVGGRHFGGPESAALGNDAGGMDVGGEWRDAGASMEGMAGPYMA